MRTTRNRQIDAEPGQIGRRDDLVDEDAGGDRDRQAEDAPSEGHGEHHPQLARQAAAGSS